jgi:hypothetical protein
MLSPIKSGAARRRRRAAAAGGAARRRRSARGRARRRGPRLELRLANWLTHSRPSRRRSARTRARAQSGHGAALTLLAAASPSPVDDAAARQRRSGATLAVCSCAAVACCWWWCGVVCWLRKAGSTRARFTMPHDDDGRPLRLQEEQEPSLRPSSEGQLEDISITRTVTLPPRSAGSTNGNVSLRPQQAPPPPPAAASAQDDQLPAILTPAEATEEGTCQCCCGFWPCVCCGLCPWAERVFGNTDVWCWPLWWPLKKRHLPQRCCWRWFWIVLLGVLGPVWTVVRFAFEDPRKFSTAYDLLDLGALLWLFLVGPVIYDVLEVTRPELGCPAKLLQSVRQAGIDYRRCGSMVIYSRLIACGLRCVFVTAGTAWLIIALVHFVATGKGGIFNSPRGHVHFIFEPNQNTLLLTVGGLVIMPIAVTWLTALFLCVDLAKASMDHIKQRINQGAFNEIDDATWRCELIEPIRDLVRNQLSHFCAISPFGVSIVGFCVVSVVSAVLSIPESVATYTGSNGRDPSVALGFATRIFVYLLVPLLLLLVPTQLTTRGIELVDDIHEMRVSGAGLHYDRVSALEDYLRNVNMGKGPGFRLIVYQQKGGIVITMKLLVTAISSLFGIYPVVVYLINEYA